MTVQYQIPVRNQCPQIINYTFRDQTKSPIDLTPFLFVTLYIKQQGVPYGSQAAAFVVPRVNGQVSAQYTFNGVGIWDVQFIVVDGANNELPGEPIQIQVVPNVPDLTISQLANY